MARPRLPIVPHLSPDEISRRYRACRNGVEKIHWLYVYGFVHPANGRNLELILPAANTDWMGLALGEFARWVDPEGAKVLVLLVDNAGWHVARRLAVPANVVLHRLPCTPELQPVEPLWPLLREVVANAGFESPEEREPLLVGQCCWLIDHPEVVRGAVGFRWAVALNSWSSRQFCNRSPLSPSFDTPSVYVL